MIAFPTLPEAPSLLLCRSAQNSVAQSFSLSSGGHNPNGSEYVRRLYRDATKKTKGADLLIRDRPLLLYYDSELQLLKVNRCFGDNAHVRCRAQSIKKDCEVLAVSCR